MKNVSLKGTAAAVGSTSLLALLASATQTVAQDASGLYMGFGMGTTNGDQPAPGPASEEYAMGGQSLNVFIGVQRDMGDGMFGGVELAYTGPTEGDAQDESSYEYAYDTNYTLDAKARIGKTFGTVEAYGFGGVSTGSVASAYYGSDYNFYGLNVGAGAQMSLAANMFAGVEYIQRFTTGSIDSGDEYKSSHGTLSLRLGYKF